MIPKALEERNDQLWKKLVPAMGKCETLEGETLRAMNRILYRYYNDGDYWYERYGTETAGPAETFLYQSSPIDVRTELKASDGARNREYEKQLNLMLVKIVNHIETRTEYAPNDCDMLDCESRYEDDRDEDEEEY